VLKYVLKLVAVTRRWPSFANISYHGRKEEYEGRRQKTDISIDREAIKQFTAEHEFILCNVHALLHHISHQAHLRV
jgi:hypothetical protein